MSNSIFEIRSFLNHCILVQKTIDLLQKNKDQNFCAIREFLLIAYDNEPMDFPKIAAIGPNGEEINPLLLEGDNQRAIQLLKNQNTSEYLQTNKTEYNFQVSETYEIYHMKSCSILHIENKPDLIYTERSPLKAMVFPYTSSVSNHQAYQNIKNSKIDIQLWKNWQKKTQGK